MCYLSEENSTVLLRNKELLCFALADGCGFFFLPLQLFGCVPKQAELSSGVGVRGSLRPGFCNRRQEMVCNNQVPAERTVPASLSP